MKTRRRSFREATELLTDALESLLLATHLNGEEFAAVVREATTEAERRGVARFTRALSRAEREAKATLARQGQPTTRRA